MKPVELGSFAIVSRPRCLGETARLGKMPRAMTQDTARKEVRIGKEPVEGKWHEFCHK